MARLNTSALARLRATLQANIDAQRIPGCVVAIAQGGEVQMLEALGRRDPADTAAAGGEADTSHAQQPMPLDAIFRIYSMTKPIVSLAALMLVEEGRLQLDDPVARHLPEFAATPVAVVQPGGEVLLVPVQRAATVQDLLRHTAGLTYEFMGDGPVQKQYAGADMASRARSNAEFCKALAAIPFASQPGSCWHYSRATDVLGGLLEAVTGLGLGELLRQRILDPLGMKDTAFSVPPAQFGRIAGPFPTDPDTGQPVHMLDARRAPRFESGGGGLLSTAPDYIRFLQLMRGMGTLDGQRLVSRKTIEWMTADHLGAIPVQGDLLAPGHGFGLGYAVRTQAGLAPQPGSPGMYYWSGIGGTSFFVDPAEDMFAMLLTQAPGQRVFFRNLFRSLVYAAVD